MKRVWILIPLLLAGCVKPNTALAPAPSEQPSLAPVAITVPFEAATEPATAIPTPMPTPTPEPTPTPVPACVSCGYVFEDGEVPAYCPQCGAKQNG